MNRCMSLFESLSKEKLILGMIHLGPIPGTPYYPGEDCFSRTLDAAIRSAKALESGGATGCLIQTVDRVYSVDEETDPARVAAVALVVAAVSRETSPGFKIGVQIMRNCLRASLGVAKVAGGSFIRAGALVGMTLTADGLVRPDPHRLMEYRAKIDASGVDVIADISSQHFHWFGEAPIGEVARGAMRVGADAVALSDPDEEEACKLISAVRRAAPTLPILLAGNTNHENAARLLQLVEGAFVGGCLEGGGWGGEIDPAKVSAYVEQVRAVEQRTPES